MRRYSYGNSIYQRRWRAKARTDIADNKSRKSAQLACAGTLGRRVAVINDCSWIDGKSPQIGCIPLCNTGTTRIRNLHSLQSNRTNHEDRTVCLLGHFTLRRSSALDLLLRPQRKWPSGDRGGTVLLGSRRRKKAEARRKFARCGAGFRNNSTGSWSFMGKPRSRQPAHARLVRRSLVELTAAANIINQILPISRASAMCVAIAFLFWPFGRLRVAIFLDQ